MKTKKKATLLIIVLYVITQCVPIYATVEGDGYGVIGGETEEPVPTSPSSVVTPQPVPPNTTTQSNSTTSSKKKKKEYIDTAICTLEEKADIEIKITWTSEKKKEHDYSNDVIYQVESDIKNKLTKAESEEEERIIPFTDEELRKALTEMVNNREILAEEAMTSYSTLEFNDVVIEKLLTLYPTPVLHSTEKNSQESIIEYLHQLQEQQTVMNKFKAKEIQSETGKVQYICSIENAEKGEWRITTLKDDTEINIEYTINEKEPFYVTNPEEEVKEEEVKEESHPISENSVSENKIKEPEQEVKREEIVEEKKDTIKLKYGIIIGSYIFNGIVFGIIMVLVKRRKKKKKERERE